MSESVASASAPAHVFASPKLATATEVLAKRCDDVVATLANAIADIEAGALDPRLAGWLDWIVQRRAAPPLVAVAGSSIAASVAELSGDRDRNDLAGLSLVVLGDDSGAFGRRAHYIAGNGRRSSSSTIVAMLDAAALARDARVWGSLRHECVGLVWLGGRAELPNELTELFVDALLGTFISGADDDAPRALAADAPPWTSISGSIRPDVPAYLLARLVPAGALAPIGALRCARELVELAGALALEHGRENVRLSLQAAMADRARSARVVVEELSARKEFLAQVRDDLARDLSANIDEFARQVAQIDADELFRGSVRRALETVPALQVDDERLVSRRNFAEEERPQWWTGTPWARFQVAFAHKMRLTLPPRDLERCVSALAIEASAMVSKTALRRFDRSDVAIGEFDDAVRGVGLDLSVARTSPLERARFERTPQERGIGPSLQDRARRTIAATIDKDLRLFHIDIERRGPIGRVLEGRAAAGGISALLLLGVRNTNTYGKLFDPAGWAHVTGISALLLNSSYYVLPLLLLGFVIYVVTSGGKEDAIVHEKVSEARESFDDKLVAIAKRFFDTEVTDAKACLVERKAAALDRLDRAIDGIKQEADELDRKARVSTGSKARAALAALPTSLKGDLDKLGVAAKDVRSELTARYAASPVGSNGTSEKAGAASPALAARSAPAPKSAAVLALEERMAKRAAATSAAAGDGTAAPPKADLAAALAALQKRRTPPASETSE